MSLFSIPQAGKELGGISRTKVYELLKNGELTSLHIGRRAVITAASIEAYIERLAAQSARDAVGGDHTENNAQADVSGTDPAVA